MTDPTAELALVQFRKRQANARKAVAEGKVPADQAEAAVRPWASLVLRAGADLPELDEAMVYWRAAFKGDWHRARATLATTLATRADCRAMLATARANLARTDQAAAAQLEPLAQLVAPLPPHRVRPELHGADAAPAPSPNPPAAPGQPMEKAA